LTDFCNLIDQRKRTLDMNTKSLSKGLAKVRRRNGLSDERKGVEKSGMAT